MGSAFHVQRRGSRWELTLDVPNASVNAFGPRPAQELDDLLDELPDSVETLVLRSSKPGSFINGAGLLYAHGMSSAATALSVSEPVRRVYERFAEATPLKIAVIEGNCFGCGLELALCCDLRVARRCYEAHFKMTELVDYRFVPLFGGTWRLPRLLGAEGARRLLLDGEVWSADEALEAGLLDAVLDDDGFDEQLRRFLATASRREHEPPKATRRSRKNVPPTRSALWRECARLIDESIARSPEIARRLEVQAFARTVTSAAAKRAMSYFFTRHMARSAGVGSAERRRPEVALRSEGGGELSRLIQSRTPSSLDVRALRVTTTGRREGRVGAVRLYLPATRDSSLCEVATGERSAELAKEVGRYLQWVEVDAVVTRTTRGFVSARLLQQTRRELSALVASGVSPEQLNGAFFRVGFAQPFQFPGWSRQRKKGAPPGVVERVAAVWLKELLRAKRSGALLHSSQGDVLIRGLFDFPLEFGSFFQWVERRGLKTLLHRARAAGLSESATRWCERNSQQGLRA